MCCVKDTQIVFVNSLFHGLWLDLSRPTRNIVYLTPPARNIVYLTRPARNFLSQRLQERPWYKTASSMNTSQSLGSPYQQFSQTRFLVAFLPISILCRSCESWIRATPDPSYCPRSCGHRPRRRGLVRDRLCLNSQSHPQRRNVPPGALFSFIILWICYHLVMTSGLRQHLWTCL